MNEFADRLTGTVVRATTALEREFEASLADWSRLAFRVAYSVLRHREDAEDLAQEALTKAHGRLGQLRDPGRLRSWLVRMAWRMAVDRRESDRRRATREFEGLRPERPPTSEDVALSRERSDRLWTMIDGLSEKLRIVVVLNAIEGHDVAEVAALLQIPEGTVKSRLFEARHQLRERLR
jgi:RNA polymerase sigma-70 factor (ECF subfamily)